MSNSPPYTRNPQSKQNLTEEQNGFSSCFLVAAGLSFSSRCVPRLFCKSGKEELSLSQLLYGFQVSWVTKKYNEASF